MIVEEPTKNSILIRYGNSLSFIKNNCCPLWRTNCSFLSIKIQVNSLFTLYSTKSFLLHLHEYSRLHIKCKVRKEDLLGLHMTQLIIYFLLNEMFIWIYITILGFIFRFKVGNNIFLVCTWLSAASSFVSGSIEGFKLYFSELNSCLLSYCVLSTSHIPWKLHIIISYSHINVSCYNLRWDMFLSYFTNESE